MKISVITIAFNAADTIEETIRSVLSQDCDSLEYILIDGGSTDGTMEIVEGYRHAFSKIVSEPDRGIYDAMNKGLALASGDLIALLNADDVYAHSSVLNSVCKSIVDNGVEACYADLEYVHRKNPAKIVRKWTSGAYNRLNFKRGWMPPHPAFFVKREVYEKYGYFNTDLKTSADYELMLRFLYRHEVAVTYLPETVVKMKVGGQSNQSIHNRIKANKEDRKAWEINGLDPGRLTFVMKPLRKLNQYWKR